MERQNNLLGEDKFLTVLRKGNFRTCFKLEPSYSLALKDGYFETVSSYFCDLILMLLAANDHLMQSPRLNLRVYMQGLLTVTIQVKL